MLPVARSNENTMFLCDNHICRFLENPSNLFNLSPTLTVTSRIVIFWWWLVWQFNWYYFLTTHHNIIFHWNQFSIRYKVHVIFLSIMKHQYGCKISSFFSSVRKICTFYCITVLINTSDFLKAILSYQYFKLVESYFDSSSWDIQNQLSWLLTTSK